MNGLARRGWQEGVCWLLEHDYPSRVPGLRAEQEEMGESDQ